MRLALPASTASHWTNPARVALAAAAGALTCVTTTWDAVLYAAICLAVLGLVLGRSGGLTRPVAVLVGIIAASLIVLPFVAPNDDRVIVHSGFAFLALLGLAFVFTGGAGRVLGLFVPVYFLHAAALFAQYLSADGGRMSGLTANPNHASGLMVLGAAYLLPSRHWPLAVPLLAASTFTGSRLAMVVAIGLLAALVLTRRIGLTRMVLVVLLTAAMAAPAHLLVDHPQNAVLRWKNDGTEITRRLGVSDSLVLIPRGPLLEDGHNTPLRIAQEAGVPAAVAWVGIAGLALWTGRRSRYAPMLWAAVGLSTMDLYFWTPVGLTALWWLVLKANLEADHA